MSGEYQYTCTVSVNKTLVKHVKMELGTFSVFCVSCKKVLHSFGDVQFCVHILVTETIVQGQRNSHSINLILTNESS